MFDMHNDLLTIAYCCYLNNNYEPLNNFYHIIKQGNVKAITANLYFMSKEEMIKELGLRYYQDDVSITDMFVISKKILKEYMPDIDFKYSIEGCDYVAIEDLKLLKAEGLNSLMIVWNNLNRYGSGLRSDNGLTELGKEFIYEAMRLNLVIDVSHANEKTFNDIIDIVMKEKYPHVCASHSNIRDIFDHPRNLYSYQLSRLKDVHGKLGLVALNYFAKNLDEYIEHINYAVNILGIDNVMIASDNMDFISDEYKSVSLMNYQDIYKTLQKRLEKYYNEEQIKKILYDNSKSLYEKVEEKR